MTFKIFFTIFITVFLAEMGDKTQLATMLFSTNEQNSKILVFCASALALIVSSAIAVLVGSIVAEYVKPKVLSCIAGVGFILIGIWSIIK